jgi:ABC-type transport system involved in cytochrome c biogenesis permease component
MECFWTLVRFQLKSLRGTWYRLPILLAFIFLQLAFLFVNGDSSQFRWFLSVALILFTLILNQNFDQTIQENLADGSLEWLISQKIALPVYFLSKFFAFCVLVMCPTILVVLLTWFAQSDQVHSFLVMGIALFLVGVQNIGLAGAISAATYASKRQNLHISLPLCLIPLGLSSLIFIYALEQGQISPLSALSILGGTALVSLALGMSLFSFSLKR